MSCFFSTVAQECPSAHLAQQKHGRHGRKPRRQCKTIKGKDVKQGEASCADARKDCGHLQESTCHLKRATRNSDVEIIRSSW